MGGLEGIISITTEDRRKPVSGNIGYGKGAGENWDVTILRCVRADEFLKYYWSGY